MDAVSDFVVTNTTAVIAIAVAVGVILLLVVLWRVLAARRARRVPDAEPPGTTVRRPVYIDIDLLEELHGHGRDTTADAVAGKGSTVAAGATESGTTDAGTTDAGTTASADPGAIGATGTDPGSSGATDTRRTDLGTTDPGTTDPGTTDPGTTGAAAVPDPGPPTTEAPDEPRLPSRATETRELNDTLLALHDSAVLLDLDAVPGAELTSGKAVLLTGSLVRLEATAAAEMLEASAPLLAHGSGADVDTGGNGRTVDTDAAPLVVRIDHPSAKNGYLAVLRTDNFRTHDPTSLGAELHVLAVVTRVLGRRDRIEMSEYLAPQLSASGRDTLGDRDFNEVITSVGKVAGTEIKPKELAFRGPGAQLEVAAIYR